MDEYRIQKQRVTITVRLMSGETLVGSLFVHPLAYRLNNREEPIDLMNASEPFFALALESGEIRLIQKARVLEICGVPMTPEDEIRRDSARPAEVTVCLADGTRRTGVLHLEMPSDRPRVLDFLNQSHSSFFTLFGPDEIYVVNVRAIDQVLPLD